MSLLEKSIQGIRRASSLYPGYVFVILANYELATLKAENKLVNMMVRYYSQGLSGIKAIRQNPIPWGNGVSKSVCGDLSLFLI